MKTVIASVFAALISIAAIGQTKQTTLTNHFGKAPITYPAGQGVHFQPKVVNQSASSFVVPNIIKKSLEANVQLSSSNNQTSRQSTTSGSRGMPLNQHGELFS